MPPKTKLDEATLADFEAWVAMGAPDPREGKAASIKKVFWTQELSRQSLGLSTHRQARAAHR